MRNETPNHLIRARAQRRRKNNARFFARERLITRRLNAVFIYDAITRH